MMAKLGTAIAGGITRTLGAEPDDAALALQAFKRAFDGDVLRVADPSLPSLSGLI
jgi:hypothetical protein